MEFRGKNSFLVTGGLDGGVPLVKTFIYPGITYHDLKVPRYSHACGNYKDPATNLDVKISILLGLNFEIFKRFLLSLEELLLVDRSQKKQKN